MSHATPEQEHSEEAPPGYGLSVISWMNGDPHDLTPSQVAQGEIAVHRIDKEGFTGRAKENAVNQLMHAAYGRNIDDVWPQFRRYLLAGSRPTTAEDEDPLGKSSSNGRSTGCLSAFGGWIRR